MLVKIDSLGCLHAKRFGKPEAEVFLQNSQDVESFLEYSELSSSNRKELEEGWVLCTQIDQWIYEHYIN